MRHVLIFLFFLFVSVTAFAARNAVVQTDDSAVRSLPNKTSDIVIRLKKGTKIEASNFSTAGYYKIRTEHGEVGWMEEENLALGPIPKKKPVMEVVQETGKAPQKREQGSPPAAEVIENPWTWKFLVGMDFFNASDMNNLIGFNALQNGYAYGSEIAYAMGGGWRLLARLERVYLGVTGRETANSKVYNISVSSFPLMVGGDYQILDGSVFSSSIGALAGLAFSTNLTSTALSFSAPNVTTFNATPITALLRWDLLYHVSGHFSLMAEGSYRLLATSPMTPSSEGNGNQIFQQNGQDVPVSLNLSGLALTAGFALRF